MTVHFRLHNLEEAGLDKHRKQHRPKADYVRTLRGWFFNPNGREAAALKGWVESRFGLLTRYHDGQVYDPLCEKHLKFLDARSSALYCTNALEGQLDLLYSYCQFELALKYTESHRIKLYRGILRPEKHEILASRTKHDITILLNNINSFTSDHERADEFGDYCLEVLVPWPKIVFFSSLIPEMLNGENEYLVIGGLYDASCT
jgi:NAD+--dinitrogen-reductase ADP-D-ribosyltransferase